MKRFKIYLLLILPISLMSSNCKKNKKDDPEKYHVLKGRVMEDCTTSYASKKILLSGNNAASGLFCEDVNGNNEFYTDANGYFEINYKRNGNWGALYAPNKVMTFIPIGTNECLDIGEVNLNGTVNFNVKIQVNNTYSNNDTLYFYDWNYPYNGESNWVKKVAGPFQTGFIDSVINRPFTKYPIQYNVQPELTIKR